MLRKFIYNLTKKLDLLKAAKEEIDYLRKENQLLRKQNDSLVTAANELFENYLDILQEQMKANLDKWDQQVMDELIRQAREQLNRNN